MPALAWLAVAAVVVAVVIVLELRHWAAIKADMEKVVVVDIGAPHSTVSAREEKHRLEEIT